MVPDVSYRSAALLALRCGRRRYRPKGKFATSDKRWEVEAWLRTAAEALQGHEDQLARLKAGGVWRKEEEVGGDVDDCCVSTRVIKG
jgi:hypothetical protein